jgi:hypothetical protein
MAAAMFRLLLPGILKNLNMVTRSETFRKNSG